MEKQKVSYLESKLFQKNNIIQLKDLEIGYLNDEISRLKQKT